MHKSDGMSKNSIEQKQIRKLRKKMATKKVTVKDETLAAMDAIAYTEFRVRVGVAVVKEFKIWAHSDDDEVEKVKNGHGTMSYQS